MSQVPQQLRSGWRGSLSASLFLATVLTVVNLVIGLSRRFRPFGLLCHICADLEPKMKMKQT